MGGRNNSFVRVTGGCASKTGTKVQAEKAARDRVEPSTPGVCAQWHWQPSERQQSCFFAGVSEDGALVDLPAPPP
jgi:hypothetical protein